ncbi:hypothetical protein CXB51_012664 [Gossypium anomalum]|uniref:RNase H type-1 domain-containing protein n=1 Tax=Gossypium anomalum TaxID=47600 RepID=A0A8J6D227_9ROSI|nr:hypothetical protein CXB51_012664 [Gossypium anomalum]
MANEETTEGGDGLEESARNHRVEIVLDLIDPNQNQWKEETITCLFHLGNLVEGKQDFAREKCLINGGHNFLYLEWEEVNHKLPGQRVVEERWRLPKLDEIKINFDRAFDKQTFKSGIGIVCRDSKGKILNCRLEALACLQVVRIDLDLGYRRVVVEGDALSIIKKLQRKENDKLIGRKGNETVYTLAKEALKLNGSTYMEGRLPKMVLVAATKDARDLELS